MCTAAWALQLEVRATVGPALGIEGELRADGPVELADALARLPVPSDDLTLLRSFPRRVDRGELRWTEEAPGLWRFSTRLPERFGDVAALPGLGLWANGAWLPQPVEGGRPRVVDWVAEVALPPGLWGALNGVGGPGRLRWSGTADRLALAVLPSPRVSAIAEGVTLVESGGTRRHLVAELRKLAAAWPAERPVLLVEDHDFNRLARVAPGMVYLSDQAFRVSPGVNAFHREPVWRAMRAAVASPDGWVRDFAGAAGPAAPKAGDVRRSFGWLAWNPIIDAILNDGTTPFYSDLFHEPFPEHPSALDTLEDRIPGRAAAAQLRALGLDPGAVQGDPRLAPELPAALREAWTRRYDPYQDYVAGPGAVRREAAAEAPVEVVRVQDKDGSRPWLAHPGEALATRGPSRVSGAVGQAGTANDSWPARYTLIASASIDDINPNQHSFTAWGELVLRRTGDARNVWIGYLEHDDQDIASVRVGWIRYIGPAINRLIRQHRLSFLVGPSLLDPAFRPTDEGAIAVGGSAAYTWSTKAASDVAVHGHRLSLWLGGGFVPASEERWASAGTEFVQLLPLSLRDIVGLRAKAGWASGEVEHRLLTLGGSSDVRALPNNEGLGNERIMATAEYRWTPLRHLSVPLGFAWLTELRLAPALEAGMSWRDDGRRAAGVGANLGLYWNLDNLGQLPSMSGVAIAVPLWSEGLETAEVQYYIEFGHAF